MTWNTFVSQYFEIHEMAQSSVYQIAFHIAVLGYGMPL